MKDLSPLKKSDKEIESQSISLALSEISEVMELENLSEHSDNKK